MTDVGALIGYRGGPAPDRAGAGHRLRGDAGGSPVQRAATRDTPAGVRHQPSSTTTSLRVLRHKRRQPGADRQALGLIASGTVQVTDLVSHHFPLAEFDTALTTMASGQAIKVTIEP